MCTVNMLYRNTRIGALHSSSILRTKKTVSRLSVWCCWDAVEVLAFIGMVGTVVYYLFETGWHGIFTGGGQTPELVLEGHNVTNGYRYPMYPSGDCPV